LQDSIRKDIATSTNILKYYYNLKTYYKFVLPLPISTYYIRSNLWYVNIPAHVAILF